MRSIVLGLCVVAAGCSGQVLDSPTSPTSATAPAQTQARGGTQLPFSGSFTLDIQFAPPDPHAVGTGGGNATHLGQFTATVTAVVSATGTSTGSFNFTAANGDQLFGTIEGTGVLIEPGVARVTEVATIEGGTGRFEGATGTFTMVRFDTISTSTGSGTFDGSINLNK
jgi:hypothetical protein